MKYHFPSVRGDADEYVRLMDGYFGITQLFSADKLFINILQLPSLIVFTINVSISCGSPG